MSSPITTINPATEEEIETYDLMSDQDVKDAIKACHTAFEDWRHVSLDDRAAKIKAIGQALRDNKEDFAQLMTRRLTMTGSTLRPQSDLAKARIAADLRREVWPLLSAGKVAPVMDSAFGLAEAHAAHTRMESSGHIGKIVLEVGGG